MPGMIMVEGFLWSPLAFLLVGATLRNANPELEEAARVSGAGIWMTIRRVTMRLSLPSILALAMLVFIRAIEAFEVPALVGTAGPHLGADHRHLRQHGGKGAARYRRRQRALGADAGARAGAALPSTAGCRGTPSASPPSPARASGRGRSTSGGCATRRRGCSCSISCCSWLVPIAMLVWVSLLPFYQPVSAAALKLGHPRQLPHRVLGRSCRADRQHAAGRGGDRDAGGGAHLPGGVAGGAAGARAAGSSSGWPPFRWSFPASFSASR